MPGSRRIARSVPFLVAVAAAFAVASTPAARAAGSAYEVVDLQGKAYAASALVFTREGLRVVTPAGPKLLEPATIDWYETFHRNVRANATNVVVFKNGSLLRFDRFELADGIVKLSVASGGQVNVSESLIDFQTSVREGAMVKLPEDAGSAPAVSRSTGGAWTPEDEASDEAPTTARTRRGASLASRRRAGAAPPPPTAAEEGIPDPAAESPEEMGQAPMDVRPPDGTTGGSDLAGGGKSSPFPRRPGSGGSRVDAPLGGGGDNQESGQAIVTLATDYSGPIGGLQLTLQYPPNLQVVEPVAFTGFAGNWLATPNTLVAGQLRIAGAPPPNTSIGGGEFLRLTFVYTGGAPARQLFRITEMLATGPDSTNLPDFHTTMDVITQP